MDIKSTTIVYPLKFRVHGDMIYIYILLFGCLHIIINKEENIKDNKKYMSPAR